jgi:hypothetical protein
MFGAVNFQPVLGDALAFQLGSVILPE